MGNVNTIQSKIMQLEGGAFQSLFDEYLYKKYKFTNIQTLGVQTATNKPTKGTPDAYVLTEDGKYILINYGRNTLNNGNSSPNQKKRYLIKTNVHSIILACFLYPKSEKISAVPTGHAVLRQTMLCSP